MCRWLAYSGSPILLEELLHKPAHSLIDQSMHSRLGATTTNGDGFGVGWYLDGRPPPGVPGRRAGLERPQPCASWPATSPRRWLSPASAPPPAPPSSRPTATRSATAAGCGSTTA